MTEGPFLAENLRIPFTYCWSPSFVPKPRDWPDYIDVSGFMFTNPKPYTPKESLDTFLKAGPAPIYIGFGSIVVDYPEGLLATVLEAVKISGVRALVSKGWSNLSSTSTPANVFFLGDCPHDWLFTQVAAVVHHGGAGTTAAGLLAGCPTAIVPFFGDQPFWGDMIAASGAGSPPIPYKTLTAKQLADAIRTCLTPEAKEAAKVISEKMRAEDGVKNAVASFHRNLNYEKIRCDLVPTLPAVYEYRGVKMSAAAATSLARQKRLKLDQLTLYGPNLISIENRRWESVTASAAATAHIGKNLTGALIDIYAAPRRKYKDIRHLEAESRGEGSADAERRALTAKEYASIAGAGAMTLPKLWGYAVKGLFVDSPLAAAEGFRATPRLFGENIKDHDAITDYKSGLKVAGKEAVTQIGFGLFDIFVQPYKGAKEEGVKGALKGFGRGTLGTLFKPAAGSAGLVGYSAQGVYKSIYAATHASSKKKVTQARRVHDIYYSRRDAEQVDEEMVLAIYDSMATSQSLLMKVTSRTPSRTHSREPSRSSTRVSLNEETTTVRSQ
jgi:hypothetical protein